ncbi:MAG: VOC family protein [Stappiaceae bacterium]
MTFSPQHFTVWAEIPVTDLDKAIEFYNAVFDIELKKQDDGPSTIAMFPTADGMGVAGHLYVGESAKSGNGPTVHFACPGDLQEALNRVKSSGGKVLSDIISIPAGRFGYCLDLDGNSFGVFAR